MKKLILTLTISTLCYLNTFSLYPGLSCLKKIGLPNIIKFVKINNKNNGETIIILTNANEKSKVFLKYIYFIQN